MKKALACLVLLSAAPLGAQAQGVDLDRAARAHLYAGYFLARPDEDRGTDDRGNGWQLNFGYRFFEHIWLEGQYFDSTFETGEGNGTDFYTRGGGVDLQYGFGDREQITPFLLIGLGVAHNDVIPDALDDTTMYGNVGLGVVGRVFGLKWLRLRAEGRYIYDSYIDGMQDLHGGVGIEIALGGPSERVVTVEKRVEVPVEVVREVVREVPVYPADSDGDGVPDNLDRCPDTLPGARVNAQGCVVTPQVVTLRELSTGFEFDSDRLNESGRRSLDPAVAFLKSEPQLTAELAGHTDAIGSNEYNQDLSERRAQAVRNFLVEKGIAPHRLRARGYGETMPVATNETDEGRAQNRRTELRIDGAPGATGGTR